jgi:hypothetical protein
MALVSAFAFLCQQVLTEKDNVNSAIRIVEIFSVTNALPVDEEGKFVAPLPMCLYVNIRLTADDDDPHSISYTLVRPDGESRDHPVVQNQIASPSRYPSVDRMFVVIGQIAVEVKQLGNHQIKIQLDGQEVARTFFTVVHNLEEPLRGQN